MANERARNADDIANPDTHLYIKGLVVIVAVSSQLGKHLADSIWLSGGDGW